MFLKKIKRNNKGNSSFLWVLILMIVIYMFGFSMDFLGIMWARHVSLEQLSLMTNTCAKQGGFDPQDLSSSAFEEDGVNKFWDFDNYYRKADAYNLVKNAMESTIVKQNWIMTFNNVSLKGSGDINVPKGTVINSYMEITYRWNYLSQMLPTNQNEQTYVLVDKAVSEKHRRNGSTIN